jgi:hypothetical protein
LAAPLKELLKLKLAEKLGNAKKWSARGKTLEILIYDEICFKKRSSNFLFKN